MTTYDIRLLILCTMTVFLFRARFPLTKLLTKFGFFITRKGPHNHVIVYSSFVKERIDNEKAGELI